MDFPPVAKAGQRFGSRPQQLIGHFVQVFIRMVGAITMHGLLVIDDEEYGRNAGNTAFNKLLDYLQNVEQLQDPQGTNLYISNMDEFKTWIGICDGVEYEQNKLAVKLMKRVHNQISQVSRNCITNHFMFYVKLFTRDYLNELVLNGILSPGASDINEAEQGGDAQAGSEDDHKEGGDDEKAGEDDNKEGDDEVGDNKEDDSNEDDDEESAEPITVTIRWSNKPGLQGLKCTLPQFDDAVQTSANLNDFVGFIMKVMDE
eukprot:46483_1